MERESKLHPETYEAAKAVLSGLCDTIGLVETVDLIADIVRADQDIQVKETGQANPEREEFATMLNKAASLL